MIVTQVPMPSLLCVMPAVVSGHPGVKFGSLDSRLVVLAAGLNLWRKNDLRME